jgi:hypothetical protein
MTIFVFSWVVESTDMATHHMVVKYTPDGAPGLARSLNIPIPAEGVNVEEHVRSYAPTTEWQRVVDVTPSADVQVGLGGTTTVDKSSMEVATPEVAQTVGDWQEEYLRALIYQVLEEVREAQA